MDDLITILIVEDHELTRLALKKLLSKFKNLKIIGEAENGLEALEFCQKQIPQVILMDVSMPKMDGIQATKAITKLDKQSKIIMLTQYDSDRDIMASLAAGASGYCLKDINGDRLLTAIISVYNGDIWFDARIAEKILNHYVNNTSKFLGYNHDLNILTNTPTFIIEPLSLREKEVLTLIVDGLSNQEIAHKLFISLSTVKSHVRNILNKLSCDDRTQAAVQAMRSGLL